MKSDYWRVLVVLSFLSLSAPETQGQTWDFIKEKEGIKIYTRDEISSSLKAFKGEITFRADINKVNLLVGDANNLDWWVKDIIYVKVLNFQRDRFIQYYLIYDVPWPLANRDLALDARISTDPKTGIRTVTAKPLLNSVKENPELVRIEKYWQKWTVQPVEKGYVHVILEGFVDPNGDVPYWLYNMVVTETPYKVLSALRSRALSGKPAIE